MGEGIVSRKLKFGDTFAALFVLLLAFAVMLLLPSDDKADTVRITSKDRIYTYSLYEDRTVELSQNGIDITVVIENGSVYVSDSTCRDGICRSCGKISKEGCIVCLPAQIVIQISSKGADVIAG